MYKILTGKYDADVTLKVLIVYDSTTRGNMFKLNKDSAQTKVRSHHQRHPRSTALAAYSTAFRVQDLSADIQVPSPDGTSLPYSDERPGFCL